MPVTTMIDHQNIINGQGHQHHLVAHPHHHLQQQPPPSSAQAYYIQQLQKQALQLQHVAAAASQTKKQHKSATYDHPSRRAVKQSRKQDHSQQNQQQFNKNQQQKMGFSNTYQNGKQQSQNSGVLAPQMILPPSSSQNHHPYQQINNNITVNLNLNLQSSLTGNDYQQQPQQQQQQHLSPPLLTQYQVVPASSVINQNQKGSGYIQHAQQFSPEKNSKVIQVSEALLKSQTGLTAAQLSNNPSIQTSGNGATAIQNKRVGIIDSNLGLLPVQQDNINNERTLQATPTRQQVIAPLNLKKTHSVVQTNTNQANNNQQQQIKPNQYRYRNVQVCSQSAAKQQQLQQLHNSDINQSDQTQKQQQQQQQQLTTTTNNSATMQSLDIINQMPIMKFIQDNLPNMCLQNNSSQAGFQENQQQTKQPQTMNFQNNAPVQVVHHNDLLNKMIQKYAVQDSEITPQILNTDLYYSSNQKQETQNQTKQQNSSRNKTQLNNNTSNNTMFGQRMTLQSSCTSKKYTNREGKKKRRKSSMNRSSRDASVLLNTHQTDMSSAQNTILNQQQIHPNTGHQSNNPSLGFLVTQQIVLAHRHPQLNSTNQMMVPNVSQSIDSNLSSQQKSALQQTSNNTDLGIRNNNNNKNNNSSHRMKSSMLQQLNNQGDLTSTSNSNNHQKRQSNYSKNSTMSRPVRPSSAKVQLRKPVTTANNQTKEAEEKQSASSKHESTANNNVKDQDQDYAAKTTQSIQFGQHTSQRAAIRKNRRNSSTASGTNLLNRSLNIRKDSINIASGPKEDKNKKKQEGSYDDDEYVDDDDESNSGEESDNLSAESYGDEESDEPGQQKELLEFDDENDYANTKTQEEDTNGETNQLHSHKQLKIISSTQQSPKKINGVPTARTNPSPSKKLQLQTPAINEGQQEESEISEEFIGEDEGSADCEKSPKANMIKQEEVKNQNQSQLNKDLIPVEPIETKLKESVINTQDLLPQVSSRKAVLIDLFPPNELHPSAKKLTSLSKESLPDKCPEDGIVKPLYLRKEIQNRSINKDNGLGTKKSGRDNSPEQYTLGKGIFNGDQPIIANDIKTFTPKDPYQAENPVFLLRSIFVGRPPTVYFQYAPQCGQQKSPALVYRMRENKYKLRFKISDNVHTYNCVVNSLAWSGFQQSDSTYWNVLWSAPLKPETLRNYDMYKHCNHFPGTWQLGRKDLMYRNISAAVREFGDEFKIVPRTWILPHDLRAFNQERDQYDKGQRLWILKPAASSCGRGIKILGKNSSLPSRGQYVINNYIMRPHLIRGYKYDLRLYVLVTCFEPLTIYLYSDGLVRFATQPYNTKNRKLRFAHLTNFSVNKKANNYKKASGNESEDEGVDGASSSSKWTLKQLQSAFAKMKIEWDPVYDQIKDLVIKAIISVEPIIANNMNRASKNRHLCFEVYGFDVIIDKNLRPWLLEVNVLPSLSSSSPLDKKVKTSMMADTLSTIGVVPYSKRRLDQEYEQNRWQRFAGLRSASQKHAAAENKKMQKDTYKSKNNKQNQNDSSGMENSYSSYTQDESMFSSSKTHGTNAVLHSQNSLNESDDDDDEVDEAEKNWQRATTKKQKASPVKIRTVKEINAASDLNYEEQKVIVEQIEALNRCGQYDLIFPRKNTVEKYKPFFRTPRTCNLIVWKWLKMKPDDRIAALKDFKIRKNCDSSLLECIKEM